MTSKLLIGNISTSVKEEDLKEIFTQIVGQSVTVSIPRNPKTGSIRGYAFVELESDVLAEKALDALNGSPVDGRAMSISKVDRVLTKRKWCQFGKPKPAR